MKQMKPKVVLKEKNKAFQCKYCNKIYCTTLWRHEKNVRVVKEMIQDIKRVRKLKWRMLYQGENNILKTILKNYSS